MAASVRIEDEAFSDERYEDLAMLAGLTDADHARGKMARLWRQCTLEQSHILPTVIVVRILGPRGVEAIVGARLGEKLDDQRVRIRGTEGRIEWLQKLRDNGKFGRLGGDHGKRGGRPPKTPKNPHQGVSQNPPPAPAPAPAPALTLPEREERERRDPDQIHPPPEQIPTPHKPPERSPTPPPETALCRAPALRDRRTKLNHDAWQYAALKHAELRGEGITPDAIAWPVMPAGAPMHDLVERVRELTDSDPPDYEHAANVLRRVVDVAVAEARRERHLRWFTPSRLWDAKGFWRSAEITPLQAAQRRSSANGATDTPMLRVKAPVDDDMPPLTGFVAKGSKP